MSTPTYNATDGVNTSIDLTGTVSSVTFAHSTSGTDKFLLVAVKTGALTAATATYAGVSMVEIGHVDENVTLQYRTTLFGLINPAAGSNNVVVTLAGAAAVVVDAYTYNGVHQTTPTGAFASAIGFSAAPSLAVSSAAGELVVDAVIGYATNTMTPDASQTLRFDNDATWCFDGSEKAGGASVTMQWTYGVTFSWAQAGVSLKPAGGGGGARLSTLSTLGAG